MKQKSLKMYHMKVKWEYHKLPIILNGTATVIYYEIEAKQRDAFKFSSLQYLFAGMK